MIELRPQHPLAALLRAAGLARSTFYYQQTALQIADKYAATKDQIKAIYDRHKGRYGYRRITATLRRQGSVINHKTVQTLMEELQLKSLVRLKKYRSYRGQVGQVAPNLIDRDFDAARPNEKWVTDAGRWEEAVPVPRHGLIQRRDPCVHDREAAALQHDRHNAQQGVLPPRTR